MPVDGESEHLQFTASFEVYPDVVVGDISGVAIDRPQVAVGDAEVDKTIEILRKQRVTYAPVERQAATGDQVEIDYRGTLNGEEFQGGQAQGYKLVLGEGQTLKDFEGAILGMTAGESKSFELTFPEDYHAKELAGKTVIFAVTLNRVAEPKLPEVDADFAKSLGVSDGSMETMRSEIKANLEREVKKRIDGRVKERVMQALLDATPFEQPRSLIEMEIDNLRQQAGEDLRARGLSASGDISLPAHLFEDQARRRVSLGLIMSELVNAHQLLAKPEQVRELVNDLAQSYEQPEHVLAWCYAEPNRLASVESLVIEDNVVQWVLERAEVVEVTSAFDELMGNNQ